MNWKKYVLALFITGAIFATAFYLAARLDEQRVSEIRSTEGKISLDILSTETQYDLLDALACSDISENPVLSDQLNNLANQLSVAENNLGDKNPEVISLKEQYSLLELKDYVLMQKVSNKCGFKPVSILYFYSNAGNCADCARTGEVLTYLRETYPSLRVYSFDYNLNLSALRTLIAIKDIGPSLPVLIINNRAPVYGFKTVDEIQKIAPEIKKLATSTPATSSTSTPGF